jgi:hypothetical protein
MSPVARRVCLHDRWPGQLSRPGGGAHGIALLVGWRGPARRRWPGPWHPR